MAEKVRFDGPNKIIIVNNNETELDAGTDIYSAWKRWLHTNTISASGGYSIGPSAGPAPVWQQALRTVGGDEIGGGKSISPYFFLVNGWRIRPYEGDHRLLVDGNIFVDGGGNPFIPTNGDYNVTVQLLTSTDSTSIIQQLEISNIQRLIETYRPHHSGTGNIWYWDPYGGDDSNDGTAQDDAFKTFAKAHDKAVENNHDIIIGVPGNPTGVTISTDPIEITKNYVFLRGPGRDFKLQPGAGETNVTVNMKSTGSEISGFIIGSGTNTNAIRIAGDFTLIKDLWVENAGLKSIEVSGSDNSIIENVSVSNGGDDGIYIGSNVNGFKISQSSIYQSSGHGINLDGININNTYIESFVIGKNGKYGINIGSGADNTHIDIETTLSDNTSGGINDLGANTAYGGEVVGDRTKDKILDETLSLHTCAGSVADIIAKIKQLANLIPAGI